MAEISLYRGNMHRVPNVQRRWQMPDRSLSLKDFRDLLRRRSKAFTLIPVASYPIAELEDRNQNGTSSLKLQPQTPDSDVQEHHNIDTERSTNYNLVASESKMDKDTHDANSQEMLPQQSAAEISNTDDASNQVKKRKRELEEQLQSLNDKKHGLVQVLKQILNAEEELKKRNSSQANVTRPPQPPREEARGSPFPATGRGIMSPDMKVGAPVVPTHSALPQHAHIISGASPLSDPCPQQSVVLQR